MLKAKFALDMKTVQMCIDAHNQRAGATDVFIVEPVKYSEGQTIVVGSASPIMYLIGEIAAHGEAGLLDVSSL